jgi:hypothetical protein
VGGPAIFDRRVTPVTLLGNRPTVAINNAFVSARGPPSHNLTASFGNTYIRDIRGLICASALTKRTSSPMASSFAVA